jgi:hypothetical protein
LGFMFFGIFVALGSVVIKTMDFKAFFQPNA